MSNWAIVNFAAQLRQHASAAWKASPRGGLPRLLIATLVGFTLTAGIVAGVTTLMKSRAEHGLAEWDKRTLLHIRDGTGFAAYAPVKSFTDGIIFESPANILILLPVTLLACALALWHGRLLLAVQFILSYGLARLLIFLGWHLWERDRPDLIADGAAALAAHSFPSGHAILPFTTYGLLTFWWMRQSRSWSERVLAAVPLLILALLIGNARLRLGAHWPSDVIAGWGIGLIWLLVCVIALHIGQRTHSPAKPAA